MDLEEVHAATGVRPRYLRAIEQEDWDALPEEFYARSFIRKYARYLDVDPEPLVAEYRRQRGTPGGVGEAPTSPFARTTSRRAEALRRRRRRQGIYAWAGTAALAIVIVVAIVLLASGSGSGGSNEAGSGAGTGGGTGAKRGHGGKGGGGAAEGKGKGGAAEGKGVAGAGHAGGGGNGKAGGGAASVVTLAIDPTAEVWTCVLDAKGKPLVDGQTLAAGESVGPFRSRSYTAAFGNGSVVLTVDGRRAHTPSTPSPMGLTVTAKGKVHEIPEGERPSCE